MSDGPFSLTIELPFFTRLSVDFSAAVRAGGREARDIIVERTKAGRDADGQALPAPKLRAGYEGPTRPLYRTGETVESIKVGRVRKLRVQVGPSGYHSKGKAGRAIQAIERASGKKLSKTKANRIRKAAGKAAVARLGRGGTRGQRGGAAPLPLIMYAQQAGAVGGKKAGYRSPFRVMDLSPREETQVQEAMRAHVVRQIAAAESAGSALEWRNLRPIVLGKR